MKKRSWKPYVFWILFTEAVGAISGLLTREGTEAYKTTIVRPPLAPPGWLFPIVWVILFALMGIGIARIRQTRPSEIRARGTAVYLAQLAFNFFWSIIFFNFGNFGFALAWLLVLWVLILRMILTFRQIDPVAAYLQIPYLLWVTFAVYLNAGIWLLNR